MNKSTVVLMFRYFLWSLVCIPFFMDLIIISKALRKLFMDSSEPIFTNPTRLAITLSILNIAAIILLVWSLAGDKNRD